MWASDKPLRIGGLIPRVEPVWFDGKNMKFQGYTDEVRISDVLRYICIQGDPFNGFKYDVPMGRFEVDEHTLCLWHFDERPEACRYADASGNGYDLWRSEVYRKGEEARAVQLQGKLSVTWGRLKQ